MCGKASCVIHARVDGGGEVEFVLELELLRLVLVVGDGALDELRVDVARAEVDVFEDLLVQGDRRLDALDAELAQGAFHDLDGVAVCTAVHDDFGDERVVPRLDCQSGRHAAVEAHARIARLVHEGDEAGGRQEVVVRILDVDAALDGVAADLDVLLHEAQRFAVGDLDLAAHDVDRRGSRSPDGWLRTSF